jgi:hypothetical protein
MFFHNNLFSIHQIILTLAARKITIETFLKYVINIKRYITFSIVTYRKPFPSKYSTFSFVFIYVRKLFNIVSIMLHQGEAIENAKGSILLILYASYLNCKSCNTFQIQTSKNNNFENDNMINKELHHPLKKTSL